MEDAISHASSTSSNTSNTSSTSATSSSTSSSSSSNSSEYSSENSSAEEEGEGEGEEGGGGGEGDGFEIAQIGDAMLQLPVGLCENESLLGHVLSSTTWNSLSDEHRRHLQSFLPQFPDNDLDEKHRTLQRLFDGEAFRFGTNPLAEFHASLKAGHYRPDIAQMRTCIRRAERNEARFRHRNYRKKLREDLIDTQRDYMAHVTRLPPGCEVKFERTIDPAIDAIMHRTKRRYFQTLADIDQRARTTLAATSSSSSSTTSLLLEQTESVEADENFPEGPPHSLPRTQHRLLKAIRANLGQYNLGDTIYTSTMRSASSEEHTKLVVDLERYITPCRNPFYMTDECYRAMLAHHRVRRRRWRRNQKTNDADDLRAHNIQLSDVIRRAQLPLSRIPVNSVNNNNNSSSNNIGGKKRKLNDSSDDDVVDDDDAVNDDDDNNNNDETSDTPPGVCETKQIKQHSSPKMAHEKQATISGGGGFERMPSFELLPLLPPPLPPQLASPSSVDFIDHPYGVGSVGSGVVAPASVCCDDTAGMLLHANFFALLRDFFYASTPPTVHHHNVLSGVQLEQCVQKWRITGTAPLNHWFACCANWSAVLGSALDFLGGGSVGGGCFNHHHHQHHYPDDFVPYIEWKCDLDVYQWIGAGRDSDALLDVLCTHWLAHCVVGVVGGKSGAVLVAPDDDVKMVVVEEVNSKIVDDSTNGAAVAAQPQRPTPPAPTVVEVSDLSQTPPPPRCPTTWSVRKVGGVDDDVAAFRIQERQRYAQPHRAFTYRCNGYESIVGPLKGLYEAPAGAANTLTTPSTHSAQMQTHTNRTARGHTLLTADRPSYVTLLSLVRDATARLPNGEGTRADICELLKASQYVALNDQYAAATNSTAAPPATITNTMLQSVVSGALDRMHTQFDPCVKYDQRRKIWIYLHRNRSEEDFERIHLQYRGVAASGAGGSGVCVGGSGNKAKKSGGRSRTSNSKTTKQHQKTTNENVVQNDLIQINENIIDVGGVGVGVGVGVGIGGGGGGVVEFLNSPKNGGNIKNISITSAEEREINEALQSIVQQQPIGISPVVLTRIDKVKTAAPAPPHGKSLLKIISTTPTSNVNNSVNNCTATVNTVNIGSAVNSVSLQIADQQPQPKNVATLKKQQKQHISIVQQRPNMVDDKPHHYVHQQQQQQQSKIVTSHQMLQALTPQQLQQSIKTMQFVRNINQHQQQQQQQQTTIKIKDAESLHNFFKSGKQQIILKQQIASPQQHQQIHQQHQQHQQQQQQQGPVVAKVLTNASGQVISVESILAAQKHHVTIGGSGGGGATLTPGATTLRVASTKNGGSGAQHQNIIHLPDNKTIQFTNANSILIPNKTTIVSTTTTTATTPTMSLIKASRIISGDRQIKFTTTSTTMSLPTITTTTTAATTTTTKSGLYNAKLIHHATTLNQQKLLQQQQQFKLIKNLTTNKVVVSSSSPATQTAPSIRMVNTANLNLAHIGGKPVLFTSKGQNVFLHSSNTSSGSLVLSNNSNNSGGHVTTSSASTVKVVPITSSTVVRHQAGISTTNNNNNNNNLLNQTPHQVILNSGKSAGQAIQGHVVQGHIMLDGHPIRLQNNTGNTGNGGGGAGGGGPQRVVLAASQDGGGQFVAQQILLPANFQGGAINLKALQGVKVIPIAQASGATVTAASSGGRGVNRQIFARMVAPSVVKQQQQQQQHDLDGSNNAPPD